MRTLTERQIEKAKREYFYGQISVEEFVKKVMSAGRDESERQGLLRRVRKVLDSDTTS